MKPKNKEVILGIDPGMAVTGFGVIEHSGNVSKALRTGVIRTESDKETAVRLKELFETAEDLFRGIDPDLVAVERLFFAQNTTTAMQVSQARGVMLLAAARQELKVVQATPLQVKQAVTGYGKADKKQVQEMVKKILNLEKVPKPDDAADALAVAITASSKLIQL